MRLALFPGCIAHTKQYGCELSTREVLPRLGVELVDLEGSSCCGFLSFRNSSPIGRKYLTTRNLALAERIGFDILPLCNGCHLSFCEVKKDLQEDQLLLKTLDETLSVEGLEYGGGVQVHHILEVLHDHIGIDEISSQVRKPLKGLNLAAHPGCYVFRPADLARPDDRKKPRKLEGLIRALGAESSEYTEKLDCCGSSLPYIDESSLKIAGSKLKAVKDHGFDGLVTVCSLCFDNFDGKQPIIRNIMEDAEVPVFYYPQLLGLSMGVSPEKLGLNLNLSPVKGLLANV